MAPRPHRLLSLASVALAATVLAGCGATPRSSNPWRQRSGVPRRPASAAYRFLDALALHPSMRTRLLALA